MKVCTRMVLAKNVKYNESVRMIKRLIERNNQFKAIEAQLEKGGTSQGQGALAASDDEVGLGEFVFFKLVNDYFSNEIQEFGLELMSRTMRWVSTIALTVDSGLSHRNRAVA